VRRRLIIYNEQDSYLRSVADYRNLQDRTTRDRQQAHDFALQKFARDLLPSIDNLTHALNSVPSENISTPSSTAEQIHGDLKNLHQGVQLMENVLLDVLKKHGLTKYDPTAEKAKFDPNLHDAVFMAPQPDKEDGIVFHTQTPGYMLNGRVIRAAQVGVVKNS
jgi:molecular chaperone GrpE